MRVLTLASVAALAGFSFADWNFFIGGYSGEMWQGNNDFNLGGLWDGTILSCDAVTIGSQFGEPETNDSGELEYNWCNINFHYDSSHCNGDTFYLADPDGTGNCGGVCDTATKCVDGAHFANVYDASNNNVQIGTCEYWGGWSEDCGSDGSQEYNTLVQCTVTGC